MSIERLKNRFQLADPSNTKRDVQLGPPPGAKKRSGVTAPMTNEKSSARTDYDDMSSDLEIEQPPLPQENMDFLHSESEEESP